MKLRTIRREVKERSHWGDTVALCHPKMLLIILLLVTIGHAIAQGRWQWNVYFVGMFGVAFAVLGSYRVNELHDRTTATTISSNEHKFMAAMFFIHAAICGIYLASEQGWWILLLAALGGVVTVAYNLDVHPWVHNKAVYGLVWGGFPLIFSSMLQAGDPGIEAPVIIFGAWACVVAVQTLWLWGPTTCGRVSVCARADGEPIDRLCHSPVLRCEDRLMMPEPVHQHLHVLVDLNVLAMVILTIAMLWR